MSAFQNRASWYAGTSAYWFATSFKWFILLVAVLPGQVEKLVPGGEKNSAWGMVLMIGALWAVIGPSIFGYISDGLSLKYGIRRPFLAAGASITVIALALLANAPSIAVIAIGYLLLQIGDDVGTGPYGAVIPDLVPEKHRGRASGWMGVMQLLAQIASALVGLKLDGNILHIYLAIAIVNLVFAAWTIVTLDGADVAKPQSGPRPSFKGFLQGWIDPWKSRDFCWVWFTRFLNALGFYLVQPYLRFYLADVIKSFVLFGKNIGDADNAALVIALTISLTGALGAAWAMKFSDQLGRKKTIYISGTIMAVVLVPFALVRSFDAIFLLAVVFGFGYGAYLSADWALASDVMPSKVDNGKDMGVWSSSVTSVQIIAGGMGSVITMLNSQAAGRGYTFSILTAAVAFMAGTILVRQVKGST